MKTLYSRLLMLAVFALPSAAAAQRGNSVYVDDRLNQLQQSLTMLTGQIEQLQYQNQQLQQQMEKMRTDYDFRIDQLEKGRGGAPRPGPAAGPAPSAPAPSQQAAAAGPSASGDQLYHDAFKMLQEGDYAGAEKGFRTFVQRNPKHVLAGNAQYWLGETYYARRDYQNAMTAFAEGYKVYKNSPKGPDNLLKLGITLATLGRKSDACAVFARFTQDYPHATDLQKRRIDQERQRDSCG
ncbi:tol-pal system protein YbgF [Enhydrobacter aerosaccus]|nr:tol-pal system protein YbgF [Enhydrobacter aerosaccus]